MSIDMFATRTMLRALEERRPPRRFLTNTFFGGPPEVSDNEYVDIDIIRNKRKLAPFVTPIAEGKLMERAGFSTKSFKPPYLKPKLVTTAADLLKRGFGENIYNPATPQQRAAKRLAQDLADLQDAIERRVEWMASSALFNGTIVVVGEGVNATINFGRSSSHSVTLASGDRWSQVSTATPVDDIRTWKGIVSQATGLVPNVMVIGSAVLPNFLANAQVQEILNRFSNQTATVKMDTSQLADGVTYVGQVEQVDIFTYDEWYLDTDGVTELPMVPTDKILLGSTRARAVVHYGAILDLDAGGVAVVPWFPKSWRTPDPSAQWVLVQSAPLVVPHQIDAFLVADVQ